MNVVRVSQHQETPVSTIREGGFQLRHLYSRAGETRAANDSGQDYVVWSIQGSTILFCVCDGVSLSYFGDIAARFLGNALLQWLSEACGDSQITTTDELRKRLSQTLAMLTRPGRELVSKHQLPTDMPALLREVLEDKKQFGSETTFICGRIDLPGPDFPDGRLLLAWMGDSRARLWHTDGECSASLGIRMRTEERWSTHRGAVGGEPHGYVSPLRGSGIELCRLAVYTDGLSALDAYATLPPDTELQELAERLGTTPTSDDLSFLDLSWSGPLPCPASRISCKEKLSQATENPILSGALHQVRRICRVFSTKRRG